MGGAEQRAGRRDFHLRGAVGVKDDRLWGPFRQRTDPTRQMEVSPATRDGDPPRGMDIYAPKGSYTVGFDLTHFDNT